MREALESLRLETFSVDDKLKDLRIESEKKIESLKIFPLVEGEFSQGNVLEFEKRIEKNIFLPTWRASFDKPTGLELPSNVERCQINILRRCYINSAVFEVSGLITLREPYGQQTTVEIPLSSFTTDMGELESFAVDEGSYISLGIPAGHNSISDPRASRWDDCSIELSCKNGNESLVFRLTAESQFPIFFRCEIIVGGYGG